MATITSYITAAADDGYVDNTASTFIAGANYIYAGQDATPEYLDAFFRFSEVDVPQGATITGAYLTFTAYADYSTTTVTLVLWGAAYDDADAPTDVSEYYDLSIGEEYTAWTGVGSWTDGTQYNTPSIVNIVQEIVDREGWVRNNAMLFILGNAASSSGAFRGISSYDYLAGAEKAELHITYTIDITIEDSSLEASDSILSEGLFNHLIDDSIDAATTDIDYQLTFEKSLEDVTTSSDFMGLSWDDEIIDSLDITDVLELYNLLYKSISDSTLIWDNVNLQWQLNLTDSVNIADLSTLYLVLSLAEFLTVSDVITSQYNGTTVFTDTFKGLDDVSWIFIINREITETLTATDSFTPVLVLMITDYLDLRESVTATGVFTKSITDTITATDSIVSQWLLSLVDSITVTDTISLIKFLLETITDGVTITDIMSTTGTFNISIEDSTRIVDFVQFQYGLSISDSFAGTSTISNFATLYSAISDSMTATDAVSAALTAYLSITDNAVFVDTISSNGVFYNTITEAIQLDVLIELDSNIYECWVLNTPQFYPSVYSGFNFNSYTVFNNRIFAANSTGIFELTGTTDNGSIIHSGAQFQETDFGTSANKRFRKGFLGVSGTIPIMSMEETTTETKRTYAISEKGEVSAARDMIGKKWKLSVMDFDKLDTIKLVPIVLTKRR